MRHPADKLRELGGFQQKRMGWDGKVTDYGWFVRSSSGDCVFLSETAIEALDILGKHFHRCLLPNDGVNASADSKDMVLSQSHLAKWLRLAIPPLPY